MKLYIIYILYNNNKKSINTVTQFNILNTNMCYKCPLHFYLFFFCQISNHKLVHGKSNNFVLNMLSTKCITLNVLNTANGHWRYPIKNVMFKTRHPKGTFKWAKIGEGIQVSFSLYTFVTCHKLIVAHLYSKHFSI